MAFLEARRKKNNIFSFSKQKLFLFIVLTIFVTCASSKEIEGLTKLKKNEVLTSETALKGKLVLVFAGDIMAHTENTRSNFKKAWEGISDIIEESDLAFANIETTVSNNRDYTSYPKFSAKEEYIDEVINIGFNVFSLANNHCNDYGEEGLKETREYFKKKEKTKSIYFSGIKEEVYDEITFSEIKKKGWKIGFIAITELLNSPEGKEWVDFVPPKSEERKKLLSFISEKKKECDLLVLSLHSCEEEYVRTVNKSQKEFYLDLSDAGVDILWINHPHVAKSWDVITDSEKNPRKIIFYGMGNTISGQRRKPDFTNPQGSREYTGDGYIVQVALSKDDKGVIINRMNPFLITTVITKEQNFVLKKLDDSFLDEIKDDDKWEVYLRERKKLMNNIEGNLICK